MLHTSGNHTNFLESWGCLMHCFRAPNGALATRKRGKECYQEEPAAALILSFTLAQKSGEEKQSDFTGVYTSLSQRLENFFDFFH